MVHEVQIFGPFATGIANVKTYFDSSMFESYIIINFDLERVLLLIKMLRISQKICNLSVQVDQKNVNKGSTFGA